MLSVLEAVGFSVYSQNRLNTSYNVQITHKGIQDQGKVSVTLHEFTENSLGKSLFYTDIESVICGSKVCKVVMVRLYWDTLGKYQKFELEEGVDLEKEEGLLFTEEDYLSLHNILNNEASVLKDYFKEQLVKQAVHNAYDALSGATISLGNDEIVQGAVWTCYTLWHWANGELVDRIRTITAQKYTDQQLQYSLDCGSYKQQVFAMEFLTKRNSYTKASLEAVYNANYHNTLLNNLAIGYLERSIRHIYLEYIHKMYTTGSKSLRLLSLNSLKNSEHQFTAAYMEPLGGSLTNNTPYPEFNLFLDILEERKINSSKLTNQLLKLLESSNTILARRAYWYLQSIKLEGEQIHKLEGFKNLF